MTGVADRERPPWAARALVGAALVLLLVPGLVGFEAWPLTAWRLFSAARDEAQTRWVIHALDARGDVREVSLEELPLPYRQAEWPMSELPGAPAEQREDLCLALADAVARIEPGLEQLRVVRDRQTLVETGEGWEVSHEPETVHACKPGDRA